MASQLGHPTNSAPQTTHNRHPIAHPQGWGMGCLLLVHMASQLGHPTNCSQQTPHSLPTRARYGVSFVSSYGKSIGAPKKKCSTNYSQQTPHYSPARARYGVSFVSSADQSIRHNTLSITLNFLPNSQNRHPIALLEGRRTRPALWVQLVSPFKWLAKTYLKPLMATENGWKSGGYF